MTENTDMDATTLASYIKCDTVIYTFIQLDSNTVGDRFLKHTCKAVAKAQYSIVSQ